MSTTLGDPKPKRRWLRFSLRGLMLLVLVISVALGWTIHEARQQGIAVAAVEKMGCEIFFTCSDSAHFAPHGEPNAIESLRQWFGEQEYWSVRRINANGASGMSDVGLTHIEGLDQLIELRLWGRQISDAGLSHLQGLQQLTMLVLGDTPITDAGLAYIKGLTKLASLHLDNTCVTDAGLVHLRRLTNLRFISLNGTQVTDAGLFHLHSLAQLDLLILSKTAVTDNGVQKLQKALPKCQIDR